MLQAARSLRSDATNFTNVSAAAHTFHSAAVHRVLVTGSKTTSHRNNAAKLSINEADVLAAHKHDRFCEQFCYNLFTIENEEPTQILRKPCKEGCLRMYSH